MREKEHHIQDALELLAVARLQQMAEAAGVAITQSSRAKFKDFQDYATERGITEKDLSTGPYSAYRQSLDTHLPTFFERLVEHYDGERFDVVNVEVEHRNAGKKGDFEIRPEKSPPVSVSLKNYRGSAERPQFNAQTFNSFALSFLFPKAGSVGMFIDTSTGKVFAGRNRTERDAALRKNGYGHLVEIFHELDAYQDEIRETFVDSPEWEFLDEKKFDPIRKRIGTEGAKTMERFLTELPDEVIKARLLAMAGLDGSEAVLLMDPRVMAESVTEATKLRHLYTNVQADHCSVRVGRRGQSIHFELIVEGEVLVSVQVPHTINKNGAWIDDESFKGGKLHAKEGKVLKHRQRRPKKSKQISTSINTYMDLGAAGIFTED
jgi:succinate dehydrogenase flavin-adding protein (antitoxin of CptAB toxin-antitoxin module)